MIKNLKIATLNQISLTIVSGFRGGRRVNVN